jgi:hypothetical protein
VGGGILIFVKNFTVMKRLILLLATVATSLTLAAQSLNYTLNLSNEGSKAISGASIFVEIGRTDESGCYKINAKYNTNLLIDAQGYSLTGLILKADPLQRVVPHSATGKKNTLEYPQSLKCELEYPLYVVNGVFVPSFKPYNYTDSQIAGMTTTKKWNKVTKAIFKDTEIESIDVARRGVAMITTKESLAFNTPKNKAQYTVVVVDTEGKPIKDAVVYVRRGRTDDTGSSEFKAKAGRRAIITSAKYENYSTTLTEQTNLSAIMTRKPKQKGIETKHMPSFDGGSISKFRQWFMNYAMEDLQKYSQADDTTVVAQFIVGKSGRVVCVEIIKQNNPRAARIVKNAIYRSPQWSPGMEDGKPVNVSYVFPVNLRGTENY